GSSVPYERPRQLLSREVQGIQSIDCNKVYVGNKSDVLRHLNQVRVRTSGISFVRKAGGDMGSIVKSAGLKTQTGKTVRQGDPAHDVLRAGRLALDPIFKPTSVAVVGASER